MEEPDPYPDHGEGGSSGPRARSAWSSSPGEFNRTSPIQDTPDAHLRRSQSQDVGRLRPLSPSNHAKSKSFQLGAASERSFVLLSKSTAYSDIDLTPHIEKGCITIGRANGVSHKIDNNRISGKHCKIIFVREGGRAKFVVEDLSKNGTFINNTVIGKGKTRTLHNRDELSLVRRIKRISMDIASAGDSGRSEKDQDFPTYMFLNVEESDRLDPATESESDTADESFEVMNGAESNLDLPPVDIDGTASGIDSTPGPTPPSSIQRAQSGDVAKWSLDDVCSWLDKLNLQECKDTFCKNHIDGGVLMLLTADALRDELKITSYGHRMRLSMAIEELRELSASSYGAASAQPAARKFRRENESGKAKMAVLYASPLVITNKKGESAHVETLDFQKDRMSLLTHMEQTQRSVVVRFESATVDKLQTLVTLGYSILHFSGHGYPDSLAFEDGDGGTHLLDTATLRSLLVSGTNRVDIVFVNACYSEATGSAFVDAGVPHVVAVHSHVPVMDKAALKFASQFYLALLSGKTVLEAFTSGQAAVNAASDLGAMRSTCCCAHLHNPACPWLLSGAKHSDHGKECCCDVPHTESMKFLLLPKDGNHNVALFSDIPRGKVENQTVTPPNNLPNVAERFLGRNADMHKVCKKVLSKNRRLVTIRGAPGIGKTALAVAVTHYVNERHHFSDGCFYVPLRGVESAEALRFAVASSLSRTARDDDELFNDIRHMNMLILLDNCEDPLNRVPNQGFREFVRKFLENCHFAKLLLTSRQSLGGGLGGVTEQVFPLSPLDAIHSAKLFISSCPRDLKLEEIGSEGPTTSGRAIEMLSRHSVMKFLAGHPLYICVAASQLSDRTLPQLSEIMRDERLKALQVADMPEDEQDAFSSARKSLDVSVDHLREHRPDAIRLLSVMGLMPSGALSEDLDIIWGEGWRSLMDALVRASLVQRTELPKKLANIIFNGIYQESSRTRRSVIELYTTFPVITDYAEGLLSEEDRKLFSSKLSERYSAVTGLIYVMIQCENVAADAHSLFALGEANIRACLRSDRPCASSWSQPLINNRAGNRGSGRFGQLSVDPSPIGLIGYYCTSILHICGRSQDGVAVAEAAVKSCQQIGDQIGEANSLLKLAELQHVQDLYEDAEKNLVKAKVIFKACKDSRGAAKTLSTLGDLFRKKRDYKQSMEYLNGALEIFQDKAKKYELGEANTLCIIGDTKREEREFSAALEHYKRALELYATGDHPSVGGFVQVQQQVEFKRDILTHDFGRANAMRGQGEVFLHQGELSKAEANLHTALKIYQSLRHRYGEASSYRALGELSMKLKQVDGALRYLELARNSYKYLRNRSGEARASQKIGEIKLRNGQTLQARSELQKTLNLYVTLSDKVGMEMVNALLKELEEQQPEEYRTPKNAKDLSFATI